MPWQADVGAETFRGYVAEVYSSENSLTMLRTDVPGLSQEVRLYIPPDARLKNIPSLEALDTGDGIRVEAFEPELGLGPWIVRSIEKTGDEFE